MKNDENEKAMTYMNSEMTNADARGWEQWVSLKPVTKAFINDVIRGTSYADGLNNDWKLLSVLGAFIGNESAMYTKEEQQTLYRIFKTDGFSEAFEKRHGWSPHVSTNDEVFKQLMTDYDEFQLNAVGKKTEEYYLPAWSIPAIQYGDYSGIEDSEIEQIEAWVEDSGFISIDDISEETEFRTSHAINALGDDCYTVKVIAKFSESELQSNSLATHFKIQGHFDEENDLYLCWSNCDGWVDPDRSDVYPLIDGTDAIGDTSKIIFLNRFGEEVGIEKVNQSLNSLTSEFTGWCDLNGLPQQSADELLYALQFGSEDSEIKTDNEHACEYLEQFIARWEIAQDRGVEEDCSEGLGID
ncbi:MAG: hypothetical protein EBR50_06960 [Proteobacteria bacterium]|nr:hypothetical protein [Pseudomonadota bacterium]